MKKIINKTEYEIYMEYLKNMTETLRSFAEVSRKMAENIVIQEAEPKSYLAEFHNQKQNR
jgi:hypothetical protein